MIKAYFFDWMGTLGDVNGKDIREFITRDEHYSLLMNSHEKAIVSEKDRVKLELSNARHWIYPDSEKIINRLKLKYRLSLISNVYDITAKMIRQLFPQFLNNFDVVTFSSEVGLKKPDSKIFNYTLDELNKTCGTNILLDEVAMVGDDFDKDIKPALELKMQAKLINRNNHQNLEEII